MATKSRTNSRVLDYVTTHAWALRHDTFQSLCQVLQRHLSGERLPTEDIDAIVEARDARTGGDSDGYRVDRGVAIIPIEGVLAKHSYMVNGASQPRGTATTQISRQLKSALADEEIHSILLDIDSPGGSVDGLEALASNIHAARQQKPVVAYAQDNMASAAYWVGSQAERIYAGPGAAIGSIGVIAALADNHRALRDEGIDPHVVTSGDDKAPVDRVSGAFGERQREKVQTMVDRYADLFVSAVARGRSMDEAEVRKLATGEIWIGEHAEANGLVDGIRSFDDVLEDLVGPPTDRSEAWIPEMGLGPPASVGGITVSKGGTSMSNDEKTVAPVESTGGTAPPDEPKLDMEAVREAARAEAIAAERARIAAIQEEMAPGQEHLRDRYVRDGTSAEDAIRGYLKDARERMRNDEARVAVGQDDADAQERKASSKGPKTWEELSDEDKHRWTSESSYNAYHRAYAAGLVRFVGDRGGK